MVNKINIVLVNLLFIRFFLMYKIELNRSLSEIRLILNIKDVEGTYFPFQERSLGDAMPIVFDDKIRIAKWDHIFGKDMILFNQIDPSLFQENYFRCVVPINGFFILDRGNHINKFYEENKSLFFLAAICDKNNNFDFIMVENEDENQSFFFPFLPLCLSLNDINIWIGPLYSSILTNNERYFVKLDFMEVFQQEGPNPVYFTYIFDQIRKYRIDLNKKLKNITPSINEVI